MSCEDLRIFVKGIAEENPIENAPREDACRFCDAYGAESSWGSYLAHQEKLDNMFLEGATLEERVPFMMCHHNGDCEWVRANQLVRET